MGNEGKLHVRAGMAGSARAADGDCPALPVGPPCGGAALVYRAPFLVVECVVGGVNLPVRFGNQEKRYKPSDESVSGLWARRTDPVGRPRRPASEIVAGASRPGPPRVHP